MDDKTKATLTNVETWKRGLFMIVFAIISGLAKLLVTLVAVFQFITVLVKGQTNEAVLPFGQNLSTYIYQITLFLTFNTDDMPFPFMDFPDGAPVSQSNYDDEETIVTSEATTNDEDVIDAVSDDIHDELGTKKNSGDEPLNA